MRAKIFKKIFWFKSFLRGIFWRFFISGMSSGSKIFGRIIVFNPENIEIGEGTTINEGVFLNARSKIIIGSNVRISPYCIINTVGLDYKNDQKTKQHWKKEVTIKDGVWLGSGVIVNPGITIGSNSVVGAGAVVTKDIPDNSVAVGVPARVIKNI